MKKKIKELASLLLRVGLSAALLFYLFKKIDVAKMMDILKEANFAYLFAGLFFMFVIYFLILIRWDIIIRYLGIKVPFKSVARCFLIGSFFNLFLPTSTGGDVVKTIGLFRDTSEKTKVVASVLLDRVFGLVALVIVSIVAFASAYRIVYDKFLLIAIGMISLATALGILFLFNERLYSFACQVFNKWPVVKDKLMELHYAIVLIKEKKQALFLVISISCFVQVLLAIVFYLTAKGLHQDVGLIYWIIFVPLICVASAFPSIGGLGVRDVSSVYLFSKVGVAAATAASMSLINFLFMAIIGLIGAMVYVCSLSHRRVQCCLSDSKSSEG
ncbi:MAG: lysylphosphatidylglycerol synthase transmembrane domain-containing protein [Candidatus Omnitrophica bacterium]|nr:lysylphosphatidylglycerol synthase transmembrane domain-containing protein [Candidatus Omnitrophota bacterium]